MAKIIQNHDQVLDWIADGEGATLDFKLAVTSSRKIAKTITAFANNKGGKIIVGVGDYGDIRGIDPEEEIFMLEEAARHYCDPPLELKFTRHEEDGYIVLETIVPDSKEKPHFAQDEDGTWKLYIRSGDQCRVVSKITQKSLETVDMEEDEMPLDSKEIGLLEILSQQQEIGIAEFGRRMNISFRRARRMMIDLTNRGYLLHHKDERGDIFTRR